MSESRIERMRELADLVKARNERIHGDAYFEDPATVNYIRSLNEAESEIAKLRSELVVALRERDEAREAQRKAEKKAAAFKGWRGREVVEHRTNLLAQIESLEVERDGLRVRAVEVAAELRNLSKLQFVMPGSVVALADRLEGNGDG